MSNVVTFPPERSKCDTSELELMAALGQAHAIVQLLQVAERGGEIKVRLASDVLDQRALGQALYALGQELRKARGAWDRFLDGLAAEQRAEPPPSSS